MHLSNLIKKGICEHCELYCRLADLEITTGDNFSPRMPCQGYVRGGGEGKRRILIGPSVPPTPFGMTFGRLKLSPQEYCGD
jgi:hypothetical protein